MKIQKHQNHVWNLPNWTSIDIESHIIDSWKKWFNFYIQWWIHWWEITYRIIENIYNYLSEKWLESWKVCLVPIANPISRNQRTYFYTFWKFDLYMGKDWNHNFPWSETWYLWQRICNTLFWLWKKYDFVLDLHTARDAFPFSMLTNVHTNEKISFASKKEYEYAKIMGIEYNLIWDDFNENDGTDTFSSIWIPAITLECGSHNKYQPQYIKIVTDSILRLMKNKWMIKEDIGEPNYKPKKYTDIKNYKSIDWWFVKFKKSIWDKYKKWDVLYLIKNVKDIWSEDTKVFAEESWIIQKISPTYIYRPWDDIIAVIPDDVLTDL